MTVDFHEPVAAEADPRRASVIIPLRNRPSVLDVLDALARQRAPAPLLEVIVVDVESTDDTQATARSRRYPFELRWETRPFDGAFNRSRVRNWGIEAARGEVALFLDADVLAGPDLVREHVRCFTGARWQEKANAGYVYGASMTDPGSRTPEALQPPPPSQLVDEIAALAARTPAWNDERDRALAAWPALAGCPFPWNYWWSNNGSCSVAAARAIGGFDETMGAWGFEDVEFAYRLHQHGADISALRSAWAVHYPHPVSPTLESTALVNARHFVRKHPDAMVEATCWTFLSALRSPSPASDDARARTQLMASLLSAVRRPRDAAPTRAIFDLVRSAHPGRIAWFGEAPSDLPEDLAFHARPFSRAVGARSGSTCDLLGLFTGFDDNELGATVAVDYWRWLPARLLPHLIAELTRIAEVAVLVQTSPSVPSRVAPQDVQSAMRTLEGSGDLALSLRTAGTSAALVAARK